jgi:hypothetical protein
MSGGSNSNFLWILKSSLFFSTSKKLFASFAGHITSSASLQSRKPPFYFTFLFFFIVWVYLLHLQLCVHWYLRKGSKADVAGLADILFYQYFVYFFRAKRIAKANLIYLRINL